MTVRYHLPGSLPPSNDRCDWHYLLAVVNANGSISSCCGVQEEKHDFGTIANGTSFREVWTNAKFRSARRRLGAPSGMAHGEPTICDECPIPEDQTRATDQYVEMYLRRAPRAIRKRAIRSFPHLKDRLRKFVRWPRPRGRFEALRYENLLLAMGERAAGVEEPSSYPIGLILDPSSACALRCPFCPVSYAEEVRSKSLLDWDVFERVMGELGPYLFFVDFFNWGEPLIHKGLPRMVARLKSYETEVRISSSLSMELSDEMIEAIVDYLDVLTVSIDGFSQEVYGAYRRKGNLALALSNLERIVRIKRERGSKLMIEWQYLVFSINEHEVEAARRFAKSVGVKFRAAAPFLEVYDHADWLPSEDEFVMGRYEPLRDDRRIKPASELGAADAPSRRKALND